MICCLTNSISFSCDKIFADICWGIDCLGVALCILCPTKLYLHKPQQREREKKSTKKLFACFTHYWYIAVQKKLVFLLLLMYCLWPFSTPAPFTDQSPQVWTLKYGRQESQAIYFIIYQYIDIFNSIWSSLNTEVRQASRPSNIFLIYCT